MDEKLSKLYLEELTKLNEKHIEDVKKEMNVVYEEYNSALKEYTEKFQKKHKIKSFDLDSLELEDPNSKIDEEELYDKWESGLEQISGKIEKKHFDNYDIEHEEYMICVSYYHGDYFIKYTNGEKFEIKLTVDVEKALENTFTKIKTEESK
jgi:histidinol dehydrogenase